MTKQISVDLLFVQLISMIIGLFFLICGLIIAVSARLYLNGFWNQDIIVYRSAARNPEEYQEDIGTEPNEPAIKYYLVKDGPYKYSRHPIYLGQALMTIGTAFAFFNPLILIVAFLVINSNRKRAIHEEQILGNEGENNYFSEAWAKAYRKYATPLPRFSPKDTGKYREIVRDFRFLFFKNDENYADYRRQDRSKR